MKPIINEFTVPSPDGAVMLKGLFYPAVNQKGLLVICHGMLEHKERYDEFCIYMSEQGISCAIFDMRGHGESVNSSDELGYYYKGGIKSVVEDIRAVLIYTRSLAGNVPVTLFGHSFGSLAVRSFAKKYGNTIDALIVCGSPSENPAAGAGIAVAELMSIFGSLKNRSVLIDNLVFGNARKAFAADGRCGWLSSNRESNAAYEGDPLCGFVFTLDGFITLFRLMKDVYKTEPCVNQALPVLFISGAGDPMRIGNDEFFAAAESMKKCGYKNVRAHLFEGARHEILNECDEIKKAVYSEIADFTKNVG
ncbi:Monoacylglycerol lipase [bioreactor metagenome]|uniref:Monoacylglycerol lipase n=1 Tax=bioreactor metagenome TaxID=1076179 RepID=A0A645D609_9ZZZZ|nr:alpha/beta hydrolase [Oscillospiraceae bacterium]